MNSLKKIDLGLAREVAVALIDIRRKLLGVSPLCAARQRLETADERTRQAVEQGYALAAADTERADALFLYEQQLQNWGVKAINEAVTSLEGEIKTMTARENDE